MKNFILGIIVSIGLLGGTLAFAKATIISWYQTDILQVKVGSISEGYLIKTFDENANVICYAYPTGYGNAVSCVKNN